MMLHCRQSDTDVVSGYGWGGGVGAGGITRMMASRLTHPPILSQFSKRTPDSTGFDVIGFILPFTGKTFAFVFVFVFILFTRKSLILTSSL